MKDEYDLKKRTFCFSEESTYDDIVEEQAAAPANSAAAPAPAAAESAPAPAEPAQPAAQETAATDPAATGGNDADYATTEEEGTDEGNCDDPDLKAIVEAALTAEKVHIC